ncbi:MAG: 2-C-methyl-D-erythritol 4-phosphate cytidylyltransferase [Pseudomonadota bacterium]
MVWAVVPAAGSGARMQSATPKQYLPLAGKTVLEHTLAALFSVERITGVVVAIADADSAWPVVADTFTGKRLEQVAGGEQRCHSVLHALTYLSGHAGDDDWVLVHDAARPCVRPADIDVLIDTLVAATDGGLLGVPVCDTMKRVAATGGVTATVDRQGLWHALTPQLFRLGQLRAALQQGIAAGISLTDEASAMEAAGYTPRMVEGHRDNIKITVASDLALAAHYLENRDT